MKAAQINPDTCSSLYMFQSLVYRESKVLKRPVKLSAYLTKLSNTTGSAKNEHNLRSYTCCYKIDYSSRVCASYSRCTNCSYTDLIWALVVGGGINKEEPAAAVEGEETVQIWKLYSLETRGLLLLIELVDMGDEEEENKGEGSGCCW